MADEVRKGFEECFARLKDPRINRRKLYPLVEVLFIVLSGSICGAESWRDYVDFGKEKLEFLKQYFSYQNGIPSKNTFARLFGVLDPENFKLCFVEWVKTLQAMMNEVIAIDGKTLRGSFDNASASSAIHMVSAFASDARLVLAQQKVADKSNEITAIPKLLDLLSLKGQIVTIDAMGCQTAIAEKIIDGGGDYILALKGNQGTLSADVTLFLETEIAKPSSNKIQDQCEDVDAGHGRIETRRCFVSDQIDWLVQKEKWKGLQSIIVIEEKREMADKVTVERRFFISSLSPKAQRIARAVRSHWSVENNLHWTLDLVFNEDASRIRKDNAPENMALVRHITLNMLNQAKPAFKDVSLKGLRKKAGWGNETLRFILAQNFYRENHVMGKQ